MLWVAVGTTGLAMVCGAAMLLESHFHSKRRHGKVKRQRVRVGERGEESGEGGRR